MWFLDSWSNHVPFTWKAIASSNSCLMHDLEHNNIDSFKQHLLHSIHSTHWILTFASPSSFALYPLHSLESYTIKTCIQHKATHTYYHPLHTSNTKPTTLTPNLLLLFHYVCAHSPITCGNVTHFNSLFIYNFFSLAYSLSLCSYGLSRCNKKCCRL